MDKKMEFTTLHTIDTKYCADTVEWCSHDETHNGYFACGTYMLVEQNEVEPNSLKNVRKGCIDLYKFSAENDELDKVLSLETGAILDMKWMKAEAVGPLLGTVDGLGDVVIYEFLHAERSLQKQASLLKSSDTAPIALALDWRHNDGNGIQLAVSDAGGNLSQLAYTPQGELTKLATWHAHGFEAWTCAFDRWSPNCLYSGGDDGCLFAYDLRTNQRTLTNKAHLAGVTSLLSHPHKEHCLLTGSYDEKVRAFDTRFIKQPTGTIDLQGGVWRLKPHPLRPNYILVACMYNNFHVINFELEAEQPEFSALGSFNDHDSISYGADWAPYVVDQQQGGESMYMATCSFYDHKLCISKASIDTGN